MARVPYVDPKDVPEEHRDLLVSELQGRPLNVYRALGNAPDVLAGLRGFLAVLWNDVPLSERRRELVILAVAREVESRYEWHQHVRIALDSGVSIEDIRSISRGEFDGFDPVEGTLLRYALSVVRGTVDDDRHAAVADVFDDGAIVGIAAVAAGYELLARLLDALDVGIEDGEAFVGWEPDPR